MCQHVEQPRLLNHSVVLPCFADSADLAIAVADFLLETRPEVGGRVLTKGMSRNASGGGTGAEQACTSELMIVQLTAVQGQ
jgi:hypothetical protein